MYKARLVFILFISGLIFISCSRATQPQTTVQPVNATNAQLSLLDIQYDSVLEIAKYFELKKYYGDKRYYTSSDFITPTGIKQHIDFLIDEDITYVGLLRAEILARHDYLFESPVIKRIFNFTTWYNQYAARLLRYNEASLNVFERANLIRINSILEENYPITYWDSNR